jgi:hypothetical protein
MKKKEDIEAEWVDVIGRYKPSPAAGTLLEVKQLANEFVRAIVDYKQPTDDPARPRCSVVVWHLMPEEERKKWAGKPDYFQYWETCDSFLCHVDELDSECVK